MPLLYKLFGWWIRWQACKMSALVMSNRHTDDEGVCPNLWSATVFFESYMWHGSEWTAEDFGPKQPIELKIVDKDASAAQ